MTGRPYKAATPTARFILALGGNLAVARWLIGQGVNSELLRLQKRIGEWNRRDQVSEEFRDIVGRLAAERDIEAHLIPPHMEDHVHPYSTHERTTA